MFVKYKNLDGDSDVHQYEIGPDYISVRFNDNPTIYKYSYAKAGQYHVENMKHLAQIGDGLNSYIMNNCKYKYDR